MTQMAWSTAGKLTGLFLIVSFCAGLVYARAAQQDEYPAPRFPSVALDAPASVEEVMPFAREAASNRGPPPSGAASDSRRGARRSSWWSGTATIHTSSRRCAVP